MTLKQARNLINAMAFTASRRQPFLWHVTIHWRLSEGFEPGTWMRRQGRLFDKMTRWLHQHRVPIAFAWVREKGSKKGEHTHLLLHLPLRLRRAFEAFLFDAGRFRDPPPGVTDKAILLTPKNGYGMWEPSMQAGAMRYVLKGMCPTAMLDGANIVQALGLRHEPSLPIAGKRCGVSQSVSIAARKRAGWRERTLLPELRALLPTREEWLRQKAMLPPKRKSKRPRPSTSSRAWAFAAG